MLASLRREAVAAGRSAALGYGSLLPPLFLCPILAVDLDYKSTRRRAFGSGPKRAKTDQPQPRISARSPALQSASASTSQQRIEVPKKETGYGLHHHRTSSTRTSHSGQGPGHVHELPIETDLQDNLPEHQLASGVAASVDLSEDEAASIASEAAASAESALSEAGIELSGNAQMCLQIALDILRNLVFETEVDGQRALLDECTDMLFRDIDGDTDVREVIGALLAAAYLRLGYNDAANHILDTIDRDSATREQRIYRPRWHAAIREANRSGAGSFASRVYQSATWRRGESYEKRTERRLRRFRELLLDASNVFKNPHDLRFSDGIERQSLMPESNPTSQAFSALFVYYARRGRIDMLNEVISLQKRLLPETDIAETLRHVVNLHPIGRRPGILSEIVGTDDGEQGRIFDLLAGRFALENNLRSLVCFFRISGFGGDKSALGRWTLNAPTINALVSHAYRQSDWRLALWLFERGIKFCQSGDLTSAFLRLCWACEEGNAPRLAVDLGMRLLQIDEGDKSDDSLFRTWPPTSACLMPSRKAYATLIKTCSALDDTGQAVKKIRTIVAEVYRQDKNANNAILRAVANTLPRLYEYSSWDEVCKHLQRLGEMAQNAKTPHTETMQRFLNVLQKSGSLDAIVANQKKALPAVFPGVAKPSDPSQENHKWVTETQLEPQDPLQESRSPHKKTSQSVLANCAAAEEMDFDQKLTARAYALRLRLYGVIRRDYPSARAVFQSMIEHGLHPLPHHIAIIIESLVLQNRLEDARAVRDGIFAKIRYSRTALVVTTTLIRAFARQGRWEEVMKELQTAEQLGVHADEALHSVIGAALRMAQRGLQKTAVRLDKLAAQAQRLLVDKSRITENGKALLAVPEGRAGRRPRAESITGILQAKTYSGQLYEAQCDVARALEDGVRLDRDMLSMMRRMESYLLREIRWAWHDPATLLLAVQGELPSDHPLWIRFNAPQLPNGETLEHRGPLTRKRRKRLAGLPKHPRELGMALHLCRQNLVAANKLRRDQETTANTRDKQARADMEQLIHDAFASNVLWDEAHGKVTGYKA